MNYTRIFICIFIMAVVTYLPRMLPFTIFRKKIKNNFIKSFLSYVPYAVLASMTFPEVLYSTSSLTSAVVGFIVAILLSKQGRGLIVVAISSAVVVYCVELILRYNFL